MKTFYAIIAVVLLFGMIGDKNMDSRKNYTIGFVASVAAIVALHALGA